MTINQRAQVHGVECDVVCTGRFYDFVERRDGRWGIVLRQPIYERDRLSTGGPGRHASSSTARSSQSFPVGYRPSAPYLQSELGFDVKRDMPGLTGAAVRELYARGDEWLAAGMSARAIFGAMRRKSPNTRRDRAKRPRAGARRSAAPDQVRGPLGDHDHGRVRVAARDLRHHRRVDHAQPLEPVDAQRRVDHRPHRARGGRVVDALAGALARTPCRSSSDDDSGTLNGARSTAFKGSCAAISSASRIPASMLARSSSVVRKLHRIRGFESGSGARSITRPRLVGLITTGPKQ